MNQYYLITIQSDHLPNMEHDFKTPIENTSVDLARIILAQLNDNKEMLIPDLIERTKEDQQKFDELLTEQGTDFGIAILKLIAQTDIPADYASYPIEKIIAVLTKLKFYIDGSVRQAHDEIISRYLGVKSPESGTYAKDCVPFANLVMKLEEVRQATGNNPEDYFITKKNTTE